MKTEKEYQDYLHEMDIYIEQLKEDARKDPEGAKERAKQSLISSGILHSDGTQKEHICNTQNHKVYSNPNRNVWYPMVVSINLPQIGIIANGDMDKFWELFDERLELCKEAILCRYNRLKHVTSDVSPIHFQYGAIARLKPGEPIKPLLEGGYSSCSLG